MLATFMIVTEKKPEALERIVGMARRRATEIESLSAGPTDTSRALRITLVVKTTEEGIARFETNLRKLPCVLQVCNVGSKLALVRDFAMIKVAATVEERADIAQIASIFRARVVDVTRGSMTIECTGAASKVDAIVNVLERYGIVEMVRTGSIAMTRGLTDELPETETREYEEEAPEQSSVSRDAGTRAASAEKSDDL